MAARCRRSSHRRDVRRRGRGLPAVAGVRARPQALDAARLPHHRARAPAAGVRRRAAGGPHARAPGALGGAARQRPPAVQRVEDPDPHRARRHLQARDEGPGERG
jgi:hypothetical protein